MTSAASERVPQAPPALPASHLIALHLAPGVVFSAFLWLLAALFTRHGLTAYLAELIAIPMCLAPLLAGIVRFWSRRPGEAGSVMGALTYRERGTVRDYVVWPILLYALWGLCSLVILPLVGRLETWGFGWFPAQLHTAALLGGVAASAPAQRHVTFVLAVLLSGGLAPLVEEAYFRGFLLPRMRHWGPTAPVANALLFGVYHFFTPWNLPAVFVAFLPLAFVVQARKNFRISLVVHALFNLTGVLTLFLGASA
jgi:membrane protease YdiL (CAAX protease family)